MESPTVKWEKQGLFRYYACADQFKIRLLPSAARCAILAALYIFIGCIMFGMPSKGGAAFTTLLALFFMWPLFQVLKPAWPVTVYRSGKIKFLIRTRHVERIDKAKVYSMAFGKFPEIGLMSKETGSKTGRMKLIEGPQDGPAILFVADELANWLQVKHQKVNRR